MAAIVSPTPLLKNLELLRLHAYCIYLLNPFQELQVSTPAFEEHSDNYPRRPKSEIHKF